MKKLILCVGFLYSNKILSTFEMSSNMQSKMRKNLCLLEGNKLGTKSFDKKMASIKSLKKITNQLKEITKKEIVEEKKEFESKNKKRLDNYFVFLRECNFIERKIQKKHWQEILNNQEEHDRHEEAKKNLNEMEQETKKHANCVECLYIRKKYIHKKFLCPEELELLNRLRFIMNN